MTMSNRIDDEVDISAIGEMGYGWFPGMSAAIEQPVGRFSGRDVKVEGHSAKAGLKAASRVFSPENEFQEEIRRDKSDSRKAFSHQVRGWTGVLKEKVFSVLTKIGIIKESSQKIAGSSSVAIAKEVLPSKNDGEIHFASPQEALEAKVQRYEKELLTALTQSHGDEEKYLAILMRLGIIENHENGRNVNAQVKFFRELYRKETKKEEKSFNTWRSLTGNTAVIALGIAGVAGAVMGVKMKPETSESTRLLHAGLTTCGTFASSASQPLTSVLSSFEQKDRTMAQAGKQIYNADEQKGGQELQKAQEAKAATQQQLQRLFEEKKGVIDSLSR